jgi:hypothetical protein
MHYIFLSIHESSESLICCWNLNIYFIHLLFFGWFSDPSFTYLEQVYKRLKLTLELVKKEMEISKLQVIHFLILQSLLSCFVQSS